MLDRPNTDYHILTAESLPPYLDGLPDVAARLGGGAADWRVRDVADGNLNAVFLVDGPEGSVCVKQALPYARIHGEAWPLDIDRAIYENAYAARLAPFVGRLGVAVHHFDRTQYVTVMEKLEPHEILRKGLIAGRHYPRVPHDVADYVAAASFHTSDLAGAFEAKQRDIGLFSGNLALQRISMDLIFLDPYQEVWRNKVLSPWLDGWGEALRGDAELKTTVARHRLAYFGKPQSLIHGDLHSGSIMVTAGETRVIDGEFAFVGPSGFDVGNFIAHYAMAWFAKPHQGEAAGGDAYRRHIEADIAAFWDGFEERFLSLWRNADASGDGVPASHFAGADGPAALERIRRAYVDDIFADAVAYLALKIIRRVIGYAQVADFLVIADPERQAAAKAGALAFARSLLLHPERYRTIGDVVAALPRFDAAGFDPAPTREL